MQGQVTYTGIGGINMDSGTSTYSITGSTLPEVIEDDHGFIINVRWSYPGGIMEKNVEGEGFWGYAVQSQVSGGGYSKDSTIKSWLLNQITGTDYPSPSVIITEEMIANEDPAVQREINELVYCYISRLMSPGTGASYDQFKEYFKGCYVLGRI